MDSRITWTPIDQGLPPLNTTVLVLRGPLDTPWKTDVAQYRDGHWWSVSPAGARAIDDVSAWALLPSRGAQP